MTESIESKLAARYRELASRRRTEAEDAEMDRIDLLLCWRDHLRRMRLAVAA